MHGMLGFLLFAGALHVDLADLRQRAATIGILASAGVVLSMFVVAAGLWTIGVPRPAAALRLVRRLRRADRADGPRRRAQHVAPSRGPAVAAHRHDRRGAVQRRRGRRPLHRRGRRRRPGGEGFGAVAIGRLLLFEAGGGALLGLAAGYLAFLAMRAIDDYAVETLISIALVTGTYALATRLHMSGPIAVVVAGC